MSSSKKIDQKLMRKLYEEKSTSKQQLRDYQIDLTKELIENIGDGRDGTIAVATGGGKTKIANDAIADICKYDPNAKFIWLTLNWNLLFQAAKDMNGRFGRKIREFDLKRFGGKNNEIGFMNEINFSWENDSSVLYSTHQTAKKEISSLADEVRAIFIDEVHWGWNGVMLREIKKAAKKLGIPIIGLTATPKRENPEIIGRNVSFGELVNKGFLVPPKLFVSRTEIDWEPKPSSSEHFQNRISEASLSRLGDSKPRNNVIINKFMEGNWGKTIVFAVNIKHCKSLYKLFKGKGLNVFQLHSEMSMEERARHLREYRESEDGVLINVQMATLGIDVPDIETVFLTRPTTSDILYAQMVGRGSRLFEGKTFFNIVEFTDNTLNHFASLIENAVHFYGEEGYDLEPSSGSYDALSNEGFEDEEFVEEDEDYGEDEEDDEQLYEINITNIFDAGDEGIPDFEWTKWEIENWLDERELIEVYNVLMNVMSVSFDLEGRTCGSKDEIVSKIVRANKDDILSGIEATFEGGKDDHHENEWLVLLGEDSLLDLSATKTELLACYIGRSKSELKEVFGGILDNNFNEISFDGDASDILWRFERALKEDIVSCIKRYYRRKSKKYKKAG